MASSSKRRAWPERIPASCNPCGLILIANGRCSKRVKRNGSTATALMLDLDKVKAVNDTSVIPPETSC